ncbi:hypothetical protein G9A89_012530 [Geosiphon pyriformis]|nr:hypothetical protein G9A89_012530 [Geosiphon pyriformis]
MCNNNGKEKQKRTEPTWNADQVWDTNHNLEEPPIWRWDKREKEKEKVKEEEPLPTASTCCGDDEEYQMATKFYCHTCLIECFERPKQMRKWDNTLCLACGKTFLNKGMWNDIPGKEEMCNKTCQYAKEHQLITPGNEHYNDWKDIHMTNMNFEEWRVQRQKVQQPLEEINTRLCDHCLISCDFQYCNECDLIYNPSLCMIYIIPEEEEPISSCASELESIFNPDLNSDNDDDKNTSSSSIQYGNINNNNSNSDLNSDPDYKQYIALPDLAKKQELKWFSNNNEGIMPERAHNTNAGFNLRYPGKKAIQLEPHSHTCIDLKIALEILATTIVQLVFRSSLAKRGINIRGGIIDMGYVGNIIAMLQNNSEKAYIIEPNKKIAQAIFLPLVKVAQLVSVRNREKLGITARGIQGFGSTGRIDIPVNMAEEEIVGQEEIVSTGQAISIALYGQYMLAIERRMKDQAQIFEAEATLCKSGEIGLINLHISAKSHNHIKILIYNTIEDAITIPKRTIIEYLSTELKDQPPSIIPNFPQLCGYVDITSQTIYG